jgi:hypothetical protein
MKFNTKISKRYGGSGGGGSNTTVTESIPAWARPAIEAVQGQAKDLYGQGALSQVAGTSNLQDLAFTSGAQGINQSTQSGLSALGAQQNRLANMAASPSPETLAAQKANVLYEAQKGVSSLNTGFGQSGTLGSARQAVMQGAQNADTTGKLAAVDADYETKMFQNRLAAEGALGQSVGAGSAVANQGASGLANLGNQQRGIEQQGLDSAWQGLQRYASTIYGNPARQSATTTAGGK